MFDRFVKHFRHLEKLLRRRGRTREDTEDLIQETFLRAKQYMDEGGEVRDAEAFLVRTALNLSRDSLKSEYRYRQARQSLEDLLTSDLVSGPEELLQKEEQVRRVRRALNSAGPRARDIFIMHRIEGMTHLQIAEHFDLSPSTVEKYMARAILALSEEALKS